MPQKGKVEFTCDDLLLERGFYWAKATALAYTHEGAPVGAWYEAALPGRNAFCMRDVAHYAVGAQALGLCEHNRNMLTRFAQSVSPARKYCGFWEITADGEPFAGDYTSDTDFWYNLPANFDLLQACWKLFQWTNDHRYLHAPDLNTFYNWTVNEYLAVWDRDGDGIPERATPGCRLGIPSYEERDEYADALVMSDLIALQAQAFDAYAHIHRMKGNDYLYHAFTARAQALRARYHSDWWHAPSGRYSAVMLADGSLLSPTDAGEDLGVLPLYYGLVTDPARRETQLQRLQTCDSAFVEYLTYLPELFFENNQPEAAYRYLLRLSDPRLPRREYPEVAFTVLGAMVTGLMGVAPQAERMCLQTRARLPKTLKTAELKHLPAFGGEIDLLHVGDHRTTLTNRTGETVRWRATVAADAACLSVNGIQAPAERLVEQDGKPLCTVDVEVQNGHSATVEGWGLGGGKRA